MRGWTILIGFALLANAGWAIGVDDFKNLPYPLPPDHPVFRALDVDKDGILSDAEEMGYGRIDTAPRTDVREPDGPASIKLGPIVPPDPGDVPPPVAACDDETI